MSEKLTDEELEQVRIACPTHLGVPTASVLVQRMIAELRTSRAKLADLALSAEERADVIEVCHSLSGRALLHARDHEPSDAGDPGLELAAAYRRKEATLRRLLTGAKIVGTVIR